MSSNVEPTDFKSRFSPQMIRGLAAQIASVSPNFSAESFARAAEDGLDGLEMKDRARHIARALWTHLPDDFTEAAQVMIAALPEGDESELAGWISFSVWPLTIVVEEFGLDHFEESMLALGEMTKRFSSEFAVRPFFERYPREMLAQMHAWSEADNHHLRRLSSEGCRPRIPWGRRLKEFQRDPAPVLEILETLKDDPELYVRRSVANNLNDISKDHPDLAAQVGARWMQGASKERGWVVRHALRSLVKSGHRGALAALGFEVDPEVEVLDFECGSRVELGSCLEFSLALRSRGKADQRLVIDYAVYHVKSNGQLNPKTFKLTTRTLAPGESLRLTKRHSIRPISTRKYYPGKHRLEVVVAGKPVAAADFELVI